MRFTMLVAVMAIIGVTGIFVIKGKSQGLPNDRIALNGPGVLAPQNDYRSERQSEASAQIERLQAEITRLNKKMDRLEQSLGQFKMASHFEPPQVSKLEVDEQENLGLHQADAAKQREETLHRQFASETIDAKWAAAMETGFQQAEQLMKELGLESAEMVYHECRETMCNAEIELGNKDVHHLGLALAMPGIERMKVITEASENGDDRLAKVYFLREGHHDNSAFE